MVYTYVVGTMEDLMAGTGKTFHNYVDAKAYALQHDLKVMEYVWEYADSYIVD
tara:strand:- start:3678 stop:3836 length:159 start_codon:yes stop_codon:yes gene_type:complete